MEWTSLFLFGLLLGAIIIAFKVAIPPHLGLLLEFAVGAMIAILGLFSLKRFISCFHKTDNDHIEPAGDDNAMG